MAIQVKEKKTAGFNKHQHLLFSHCRCHTPSCMFKRKSEELTEVVAMIIIPLLPKSIL